MVYVYAPVFQRKVPWRSKESNYHHRDEPINHTFQHFTNAELKPSVHEFQVRCSALPLFLRLRIDDDLYLVLQRPEARVGEIFLAIIEEAVAAALGGALLVFLTLRLVSHSRGQSGQT